MKMKGDLLLPTPPPTFTKRKTRILEQLARPDDEYTDASPKGSVDAGIRELIGEVNGLDGFVTTSSCAGRVSVFLEGSKKAVVTAGEEYGEEGDGVDDDDDDDSGKTEVRKLAGVGGKGGGGAWLFVSHDPVPLRQGEGNDDDVEEMLGLRRSPEEGDEAGEIRVDDSVRDVAAARLVHFKFEPMILHVLTASPEHAQLLLRCGLQAGFRESGAVSLTPAAGEQHATPIVAIRSMGLTFESLIGYHQSGGNNGGGLHCAVPPAYLRTLLRIANERFVENTKRIDRFRAALAEATTKPVSGSGSGWEDAQVRRERKKAEGLKRREELRREKQKQNSDTAAVEDSTLEASLNTEFT
ncbi:methyltransferase TYW3-domain-containing protein [Daldinia vernicosa]|uniref:methyltransferase TYW3-domain-containing protein n=1 Tax=Daldinia vernicosa TaxID=114800 RepID=UPI002007B244|nr:methyltransferase TYW3-domain-containing protein [Daldinia vernicosa]KAI0850789.1 methyltransferase TYW3-domain-containing protein [Daldinia vernicosa]